MIDALSNARPFAWGMLFATFAGVSLLTVPTIVDLPTRLIWNASASVPIGLYAVREDDRVQRGATVLVDPPEPLAAFLAARGYLPRGVPLLKRVEALPGATVCRHGRVLTVNGQRRATALERDRIGRSLPVWGGCRLIAKGEIFLLNVGIAASFDGRYFGPLPASAVIGRATPLLVPEAR